MKCQFKGTTDNLNRLQINFQDRPINKFICDRIRLHKFISKSKYPKTPMPLVCL